MADCLFCKIIAREIPASIVYEDDASLAFNDINPQAPTHVLVVPKRHIATLNDLAAGDDQLVGELVQAGGGTSPRERGISAPAVTGRSSTRTATPVRRSFTSICTCSAAAAWSWPPG